jgi:hypothetical protein
MKRSIHAFPLKASEADEYNVHTVLYSCIFYINSLINCLLVILPCAVIVVNNVANHTIGLKFPTPNSLIERINNVLANEAIIIN